VKDMKKIRVLIADDHAILREGLISMLNFYEDIEVVAQSDDGENALIKVGELRPDVLLLDIAMPKMNGIEVTREVTKLYPETRILVLTQHEESQYVISLINEGASGYIPKRADGKDLIDAIRAVANQESYFHPSVAMTIADSIRKQHNDKNNSVVLTDRENEILKYITHGKTNSQIAEELTISINTVVWHRSNIMEKLNVHNVADLVRYAIKEGII
jgi:DNA-binding NarL/FixJ family response regulator